MPSTVFVLFKHNFIPAVVKITWHSLSSSMCLMVSASPLSLLYLCIIVSRLELNNEYHTAWSPVLTEICAVVVLVAFLVRNHDWQFIHLSIDLLGASQGTRLDPWLFLAMINDLGLPEEFDMWKFADDTTVSEVVPHSKHSILQQAADFIHDWSQENHLRLNPIKCKEIRTCFKHTLPPPPLASLRSP